MLHRFIQRTNFKYYLEKGKVIAIKKKKSSIFNINLTFSKNPTLKFAVGRIPFRMKTTLNFSRIY